MCTKLIVGNLLLERRKLNLSAKLIAIKHNFLLYYVVCLFGSN